MDVLVLFPELPWPATTAERQRTRHLLSVLRDAGLRPHGIAMLGPGQGDREEAACQSLCASLQTFDPPLLGPLRGAAAVFRQRSYRIARCWTGRVADAVNETVQRHGVTAAVCSGPEMSEYVPRGLDFYLLDLGDRRSSQLAARGRSQGWAGLGCDAEAAALVEAERRQAARADVTLVSNPIEADRLHQQCPRRRILVAPNGVAPTQMAARHTITEAPPRLLMPAEGLVPLHVEAAEWFLSEVWPSVLASEPEAELVIAGRAVGRRMRQVTTGHPRVSRVGGAGQAAQQMQRALVCVEPVGQAAGADPQALQALAAGRPAVVSPAVASYIGRPLSHQLLRIDEADHWPEAIARLLRDRSRCYEVSRQGHQAAMRHGTWSACWEPVVSLLSAGAEGASHPARSRPRGQRAGAA